MDEHLIRSFVLEDKKHVFFFKGEVALILKFLILVNSSKLLNLLKESFIVLGFNKET